MGRSDWSSDVCSSDLKKAAGSPRPFLCARTSSVPARLAIDRLRRGLGVEDRIEFGAHLGQRVCPIARLLGVGDEVIELIVARAGLFLRPADEAVTLGADRLPEPSRARIGVIGIADR